MNQDQGKSIFVQKKSLAGEPAPATQGGVLESSETADGLYPANVNIDVGKVWVTNYLAPAKIPHYNKNVVNTSTILEKAYGDKKTYELLCGKLQVDVDYMDLIGTMYSNYKFLTHCHPEEHTVALKLCGLPLQKRCCAAWPSTSAPSESDTRPAAHPCLL